MIALRAALTPLARDYKTGRCVSGLFTHNLILRRRPEGPISKDG